MAADHAPCAGVPGPTGGALAAAGVSDADPLDGRPGGIRSCPGRPPGELRDGGTGEEGRPADDDRDQTAIGVVTLPSARAVALGGQGPDRQPRHPRERAAERGGAVQPRDEPPACRGSGLSRSPGRAGRRRHRRADVGACLRGRWTGSRRAGPRARARRPGARPRAPRRHGTAGRRSRATARSRRRRSAGHLRARHDRGDVRIPTPDRHRRHPRRCRSHAAPRVRGRAAAGPARATAKKATAEKAADEARPPKRRHPRRGRRDEGDAEKATPPRRRPRRAPRRRPRRDRRAGHRREAATKARRPSPPTTVAPDRLRRV